MLCPPKLSTPVRKYEWSPAYQVRHPDNLKCYGYEEYIERERQKRMKKLREAKNREIRKAMLARKMLK